MIFNLFLLFSVAVLIKVIGTFSKLSEIRGNRHLAVIFLGIDSFLFLLVFKNIMSNPTGLSTIFVLSVGFMCGYLLGGKLEERVAAGYIAATIKVSKENSKELYRRLNKEGFIFTRSKRIYSSNGGYRKLYHGIIFRKELPRLKKCLKGLDHISYTESISDIFGKKLHKLNKE
ncbi:hypothetical protein HOD61_01635 [archaeon]|jgi:uncharacterized protein YebE (UPF0316 family)|nr:hypothetical protein [archaeon]